MKLAPTCQPGWNETEMRLLLSFFASMLWQESELHAEDERALHTMARELGFAADDPHARWLCELPPHPEDVDPQRVPSGLAPTVLALASLAASVRPSLAKYEALELLELLLSPRSPAPAVLELDLLAA